MRRHENRSTLMTSNRPLEDWAKLIGDVPAATAILDRFLQHATIINITGKSYRLRNRGKAELPKDRRSSAGTGEAGSHRRKTPRQKARSLLWQEERRRRRNDRPQSETRRKVERDHNNEVHNASKHWPVLKRPPMAGFNAPRDSMIGRGLIDLE